MTTLPLAPLDQRDAQPGGSRGLIALVLCMVYVLVRGQGLMALPIFSDEAIYLRWAQLIRDGHAWISLVDPKPPLHFWLLAGVIGWTKDPLSAARGLSVAAGIVSILAMMGVCDEVAALGRRTQSAADTWRATPLPSGWMLGLFTTILMIFCPFLAFYQRLATADALFVLQMLTVVWLGLRWGRRAISGNASWPTVVALGIALGAAMMTRQGLSYTLWGVPVLGVLLHWRRATGGKTLRRAILQFLAAAAIAGLLWLPYLVAELDRFTADAPIGQVVTNLTVIKQRILYQDQFTATGQGDPSRLDVATRNASMTFLPPLTWQGLTASAPAQGWLFYYLTWPVYGMCLAGGVVLCLRGEWRIIALLGGWVVLMMGPVIILGNVVYSRYVLAGAVPLLIPAAYAVAELLATVIRSRMMPALTWSVASAFLAVIVLIPLRQIGLQSTDWWRQTLTAADREQYVTGWAAGSATHKAIAFLQGYALGGPVVVITDGGWGLPADAVWAYLGQRPGIQVFYTSVAAGEPILQRAPGDPAAYLLRSDKWLYTPAHPVAFARDATILFVAQSHEADDALLLERLHRLNPNLQPVLSFYGIDKGPDHVLVCELK